MNYENGIMKNGNWTMLIGRLTMEDGKCIWGKWAIVNGTLAIGYWITPPDLNGAFVQ